MSQATVLPNPAIRLVDFIVHFLHGSLLSIGLVVSVLIAGALAAGELPDALRSLVAVSAPQEISSTGRAALGESELADNTPTLNRNLQKAAEYISRRYRVAQPAIEEIARAADKSARSAGLDPLLVLAMIGIESRFNPYSESSFGAQGLMQIIGKFHVDKFEPTPDGFALLDPATNIHVGVQILHAYVRKTGSLEAALKLYGGESDDSGVGYAEKVFAEKGRIEQSLQRPSRA